MKKHDTKQTEETGNKKIEELGKKLEQKSTEAEEWKSKCLRILADYQNLERRNREEREEIRKFASQVVLERMFSALDTLRRAKDHLKDAGLDLAFKEFIAVLEEQGVEEIQTLGKPFDPHQMECIEVVDLPAQAGGEDNKVVEEILPGYRLHGKTLRVAQVKVGKRMSNA